MNIFLRQWVVKIYRIFDFLICFAIFPETRHILKFLTLKGLNTVADRAFVFLAAKNEFTTGDILEIGSFFGSSSVCLAMGNSLAKTKNKIWLIEPYFMPNKEVFLNNFKIYGLDKYIELIDKTSEEASKIITARFRFIFIDGNHEYEYVKKDILLWKALLNQGGIIAFHDYELPGVAKAINDFIKADEFTIRGTISGILYAAKGNFKDIDFLSRMQRLSKIRERLINIAWKLKLKERAILFKSNIQQKHLTKYFYIL